MKTNKAWALAGIGVFACALFLPSCQPTASTAGASEAQVGAKPDGVEDELAMFAGYRKWHKANPELLRMDDVVAWMCRNLTPEEAAKMRKELEGTHKVAQQWKTFTVFVNDLGKDRLLGVTKGEFPVGSILVKEKHDQNDALSSELLTVMVKHEKGFAPEVGDWEFLVLEGMAKAIVERGQMKTCVDCHATVKQNDYVYADYLPNRVRLEGEARHDELSIAPAVIPR